MKYSFYSLSKKEFDSFRETPYKKIPTRYGIFFISLKHKKNTIGFTFVISKKNLRKAVERNYVRRVLKAHFSRFLFLKPFQGYLLVSKDVITTILSREKEKRTELFNEFYEIFTKNTK